MPGAEITDFRPKGNKAMADRNFEVAASCACTIFHCSKPRHGERIGSQRVLSRARPETGLERCRGQSGVAPPVRTLAPGSPRQPACPSKDPADQPGMGWDPHGE